MKKKSLIVILGICILVFTIVCLTTHFIKNKNEEMKEENPVKKIDPWPGSKLIGHAFYEIDKITYTNSLEAFKSGYENGLRTFEVDFLITSDNEVVCIHDWDGKLQNDISSQNIPTEEKFLSEKILNKYTPISFKSLLNLLKEYPDIWIVTDSKYIDKENVTKQFLSIMKSIEETNSKELLDRFIIQIYNEEMYDIIESIYPFQNKIFTLYMRWYNDSMEDFKDIVNFSKERGIKAITMWNTYYSDELLKIVNTAGLDLYLHTENNIESAKYFIKKGVKGVYTDNIGINDLK